MDVTAYTADRNYHFYAVFSRESVYSSPSDEKYFDYDYNFNYSDATGYTTTGTLIKINNNYRTQDGPLKGKLTVPKVDNYGNPIIGITGFDGVTTKNVTHIFFMEDNDIVTFTEAAFAGGMESKLKYIDFKHLTKLRNIGTRAMELLPNLEFTEIPKSVVQIKNGAITGAFSNISNIPAFSIGGRVVKMDGKALSYCNTKIGTYIIGGPEDPSQLSLDDWFATKVPYITQNQKQRPTLVKIYCKPERVNEFELALKEFRQGEGHSFITIASESTGDEVTGSYQIIETTEKGAE